MTTKPRDRKNTTGIFPALLHPCNLLKGLFLISGVASLLTFDTRTAQRYEKQTPLHSIFFDKPWRFQSQDSHLIWCIPEYVLVYRETQTLFHVPSCQKCLKIQTYSKLILQLPSTNLLDCFKCNHLNARRVLGYGLSGGVSSAGQSRIC